MTRLRVLRGQRQKCHARRPSGRPCLRTLVTTLRARFCLTHPPHSRRCLWDKRPGRGEGAASSCCSGARREHPPQQIAVPAPQLALNPCPMDCAISLRAGALHARPPSRLQIHRSCADAQAKAPDLPPSTPHATLAQPARWTHARTTLWVGRQRHWCRCASRSRSCGWSCHWPLGLGVGSACASA